MIFHKYLAALCFICVTGVTGADSLDHDHNQKNRFIRTAALSQSRNHITIEPLNDEKRRHKESLDTEATEYLEVIPLRRVEEIIHEKKEPEGWNFFSWLMGCCSDRGKKPKEKK